MAYLFKTNYGQCSLADDETGIVIEWRAGDFNGSQKSHCEGTIIPDGEDAAAYIARKMREMGDYIAENYEEFI